MRKAGDEPAKSDGDPNILKLKESTRFRILDPMFAEWIQHGVSAPEDDEQYTSVVCPGSKACPCCRKPVGVSDDGEQYQRFPRSRRNAANVWDYETNSVKVLIAGPAVFRDFDTSVKAGFDITMNDFVVIKSGERRNTRYEVVRKDTEPFEFGDRVSPDSLHDLSKYEMPTSTDAIFDVMDRFGIDYDALEIPSFTLEEAEAFVMPYGKHKSLTLEQIRSADSGYLEYMHQRLIDNGALGDPVFLAMQRILEETGDAEPLSEQFPTRPASSAPAVSRADLEESNQITLLDHAGVEVQVPKESKEALLMAGFRELPEPTPPEPEPQEVPDGQTALVGPGGDEIVVPDVAVQGLIAAGYRRRFEDVVRGPLEEGQLNDDDDVNVSINGQSVAMKYAQAKQLIASGAARLEQPQPASSAPVVQLPDPTTEIQFKLRMVPTPVAMSFADASRLALEGQGTFVEHHDDYMKALSDGDAADKESVRQQAEHEQQNVANVPEQGDPDRPFRCDCGRGFRTRGGLTQHIRREHSGAANGESAPESASTPAPEGQSLLDQVKGKLLSTGMSNDYRSLLRLFEEVAGKRQLDRFTEQELARLLQRLEES